MTRILLLGAEGMLGRTICSEFSDLEVIPAGRLDADIRSPDAVEALIHDVSPDVVVNVAAMTQVDFCETHREEAFVVNKTGAQNVAQSCHKHGLKCIHISTDYVFDGRSNRPYTEYDIPTGGTSVYGQSKRAGEEAIRRWCPNHLICRVSWLYGAGGPSFVHTMMRQAQEKSELKVVNDQIGNPTSCVAVARALQHLIQRNDVVGTLHLTCEGEATWFEFTQEIFRLAGIKKRVLPCTSEEFPRLAPRPANSRLDKIRLRQLNLPKMPHWREALLEFMSTEWTELIAYDCCSEIEK